MGEGAQRRTHHESLFGKDRLLFLQTKIHDGQSQLPDLGSDRFVPGNVRKRTAVICNHERELFRAHPVDSCIASPVAKSLHHLHQTQQTRA